MSEHMKSFPISRNVTAVADVSRWLEPPERECMAIKFWGPHRWVLGRYYPGKVPGFASDAAAPIESFYERQKLRRRRPVNFRDVLILPVVQMVRKFR